MRNTRSHRTLFGFLVTIGEGEREAQEKLGLNNHDQFNLLINNQRMPEDPWRN